MEKKTIDSNLCLRVKDAFASLCGKDGVTLSQKEISEKFAITASMVSEIRQCKREPSKALLGKVIEICYAVDPGWLLIGKLDENACNKVRLFLRCIEGNLKRVGNRLVVSTPFLLAVINKEVSPSQAFLKRLSEAFNANDLIYPKIDEKFREWFEQTIIESKIKTSEIADRLNINMEYVLAVLRGEASFSDEHIARFATMYKKKPPPPAYSAYREIAELLKNDPGAEEAVLRMLRKRKAMMPEQERGMRQGAEKAKKEVISSRLNHA